MKCFRKRDNMRNVDNPERWLPLRDRSTYRPKGKKRRQKAVVLTQGGISKKGDKRRWMRRRERLTITIPPPLKDQCEHIAHGLGDKPSQP